MMVKKKKNKRLFKTPKFFVVAFLGVASLSLILFMFYFYIFEAPKKIFKNMQGKMSQVKTLHYKGEIDLSKESAGGMKTKLNLEGDSASEGKKENNYLKLGIDGSVGSLGINASLELLVLDKDLYFKINSIPNILSAYGDYSGILNRWATTTILKEENSESLNDLMKNTNFIKSIKRLGSERIENTDTYHYQIVLEKESLKKIINSQPMFSFFSTDEITELKGNIDLLPEISLEVWIGKEDNYLYKIAGSVPSLTKVNFSFLLSKFNQPIDLKAPKKAEPTGNIFIPFLEVVSKIKT